MLANKNNNIMLRISFSVPIHLIVMFIYGAVYFMFFVQNGIQARQSGSTLLIYGAEHWFMYQIKENELCYIEVQSIIDRPII